MANWLEKLFVRCRARLTVEHEQMLLRLGFAIALLLWLWHQAFVLHTRLPLRSATESIAIVAIYGVIVVAGFIALFYKNSSSHTSRILWIGMDTLMVAGVCYFAGKAAIPLLFFFIWLPIDNGYRFGIRYLVFALGVVSIVLFTFIGIEQYWEEHRMLAAGVVINTLVLVSYAGYLINEINKTSEALKALATRDILTNLPNRRFFVEHLKRAMVLTHRSNQYCACVFLDLDGFKYVNDTHGHAIGDLLLIEVSRRIENNLRDTDLLARFGGDEFAVITQCHKIPEDAINVSHRILDLLSQITEISGCKIKISASIGVSWYRDDNTEEVDPDALIKNADMAMYCAKRAGKNCAHVIDDKGKILEVKQWVSKIKDEA